jgi:hypothetical protein
MMRIRHTVLGVFVVMCAVPWSQVMFGATRCIPGPDYYAHDCTAGPIDVGELEGWDVTTAKMLDSGGGAWEGHILLFKWSRPPTDIDHCCVDKVFTDKPDVPKCRWELHKWDAARWKLHKDLGTSCLGASWYTENEQITDYRIRAYVDDEANYADDPEQSAEFSLELCEPAVSDFQQVAAGPGTPEAPGAPGPIYFKYEWRSSCGDDDNHLAHLDDATVREYVDYQLSTGPTDFRLWPAQAWSQDPSTAYADKFKGYGASLGKGTDVHGTGPLLPAAEIQGTAYVNATQYYQWAYEIPGPPDQDATGITWAPLLGPLDILRLVYKEYDGRWWIQVRKGNVENLTPIPW